MIKSGSKKCRMADKFVDQFGEQMECFCKEAAQLLRMTGNEI